MKALYYLCTLGPVLFIAALIVWAMWGDEWSERWNRLKR